MHTHVAKAPSSSRGRVGAWRAAGWVGAGRRAHAHGGCRRALHDGSWGGDLHVDASAVVGEIGQCPPTSGGANEQLVRGGASIVVVRAHGSRIVPRFVARVARGGHDQHLRFVKVRCVWRPPTHGSVAEFPAAATTTTCVCGVVYVCLGDLQQLAAGFWAASVLLLAAWSRPARRRQGPWPPKAALVSSFAEHAAHVRVEERCIFYEKAARQRALNDLQTSSRWVGKRRLTFARAGRLP